MGQGIGAETEAPGRLKPLKTMVRIVLSSMTLRGPSRARSQPGECNKNSHGPRTVESHGTLKRSEDRHPLVVLAPMAPRRESFERPRSHFLVNATV